MTGIWNSRLICLNLLDRMMSEQWWRSVIFLIVLMFCVGTGAFVGINIGMDVTDLPSASDVVAILKANQITHVRLYDADNRMLNALAGTGIEVMVGVANEEVLGIGQSPSVAAAWINKNVVSYLPSTNITAIAVGSEVLTSIPNAAPILVPAMNYLHNALVASNINFQVKVSSPQSMDMIPRPFPPSDATFNSTWSSIMYQFLQFLKNTGSFYMLNANPYYGYTKGNGIFPLEFALFEPLSLTKQIVDPNTLFHYPSMFESMVDATYYSIEALNFSGIPVVVTETGWPWLGGANESDATVENAETYNSNLFRRVLNDSGSPSQPSLPIRTYIYELFNEDKRPGPLSEKNWGLFFTNGTPIYPLSFSSSDRLTANSSGIGLFCVAKPGADVSSLQSGLNWACGQGQANCSAIQEGQPCYDPNTLQDHASYAYNDYFHKMQSIGGTCDFSGTATTTAVDPSHGSCVFAGSSGSNTTGAITPSTALGPTTSLTGVSSMLQVSEVVFLIPAILLALFGI
ncbi:PREDICTED: glucan endo-1,3-beta-glucosidase 4-like [Nelumbo nucifera]|uniref:glucan endo-1,3-beta-D-glucosidase n=1 Tax=Nelumbo nucifera TaxID=4432 RepID=A0A1U7ZVB0_NELNU|nr:PREDICTED: glucan endo-1,3-beta-glucosidase 4-like [Nelumbo nucifera]XP_010257593.1 PREDICTED: glucan endo-1,3-beta-glucosidase 4-like [Nelumbo nucifera]XP_010257594.1 PREDICTED: glucan endo-1,3-beta-glucosidase 4-like [Nelumbo nucifera]XP_010257595.1 PREDICTED: glucan endo-1,3-beta-glucosidase 4-like [Nelumbo nucifera]XP_010257598.1 PREDICTED: glucan endo-1,3-beta-glucosidase 4-like [Nelumbo nucifera]